MASEKLPDFLSPEQREVFERTGRIPEYMINARVKEEKYEPQPDWGENLLFGLNLISNALRFAASSSSQAGKITTRSGGAPVIYEPDQYAQVSDESMKAIHQNRNADYKPSQTSRNALAKLSTHEEKMRRAYAEKAANLDALFDAQARLSGQPTYQEFHAQHGIEYNPVKNDFVSSERYDSGSAPVQQQPPVDPDFGQKPVLNAQQQITQQARYASNLAAKLQGIRWDQRQEAQQGAQAAEVKKPAVKATYEYKGENLWSKLQGNEPLEDNEMKQLFHIAGVEKALAKTDVEKLKAEALRLFIEQKMAENMVMNAERDEQGNILLQGIPVHPEDALYFARQDIEHFRDTDKHLSPSGLLVIKDSRNADLNANTAFEFLGNSYQSPKKAPHKDTWVDVARDWFFETGPAERIYDASHPITQALMKDEGVQRAREAWVQAGKPTKKGFRYKFSVQEYIRELRQGDATGSFIGSYDVIIKRIPSNLIEITVINNTGWESGTRLPFAPTDTPSIEDFMKGNPNHLPYPSIKKDGKSPFLPKSIMSNKERLDSGPGGTFKQFYIWHEKQP